jgi:hypothetical protein
MMFGHDEEMERMTNGDTTYKGKFLVRFFAGGAFPEPGWEVLCVKLDTNNNLCVMLDNDSEDAWVSVCSAGFCLASGTCAALLYSQLRVVQSNGDACLFTDVITSDYSFSSISSKNYSRDPSKTIGLLHFSVCKRGVLRIPLRVMKVATTVHNTKELHYFRDLLRSLAKGDRT